MSSKPKSRLLVIGFHSLKGGVGRTTSASMLGLRLAQSGKNVLMVDCDFEAPTLDIMFRVNPEIVGQRSNVGIETLLHRRVARGDVDLDLVYPVDVGKRWRDKRWRSAIQETVPGAKNVSKLIDSVTSPDGTCHGVDGYEGGGRLMVLPCARESVANLRLDYATRGGPKSLDRAVADVVHAVSNEYGAEIAIVDMRNGMSDAAALVGECCHLIVTAYQRKYAHVLTLSPVLHWYHVLQRWRKPIVSLFTLDVRINEVQASHWDSLKETIRESHERVDARSTWQTDDRLKLGNAWAAFTNKLKYSDFFLQGYDPTGMDPLLNELRFVASILGQSNPAFENLAGVGE